MSKNAVSIIAFLVLLVIFAGAFSSSYTSHNISNLAYVLAIGIDVLVSGEADSIYSGLNLINSYIGKEINLSHCNVVVFSEELAKQRHFISNL